MSRGRLEPVVRNGEIVPRLMLPLSLSYDHRVIDELRRAHPQRLEVAGESTADVLQA